MGWLPSSGEVIGKTVEQSILRQITTGVTVPDRAAEIGNADQGHVSASARSVDHLAIDIGTTTSTPPMQRAGRRARDPNALSESSFER
jgi:hypothetical protein